MCRPEHGVSPFCRLAGYVSRCAHGSGRSTVDRQYYYCNGRPFELPRVRELPSLSVSLLHMSAAVFILSFLLEPTSQRLMCSSLTSLSPLLSLILLDV